MTRSLRVRHTSRAPARRHMLQQSRRSTELNISSSQLNSRQRSRAGGATRSRHGTASRTHTTTPALQACRNWVTRVSVSFGGRGRRGQLRDQDIITSRPRAGGSVAYCSAQPALTGRVTVWAMLRRCTQCTNQDGMRFASGFSGKEFLWGDVEHLCHITITVHFADTIGFEMNQGRGSSASEAVKLYQKLRITHCSATAEHAATHLTSVLLTPQRI